MLTVRAEQPESASSSAVKQGFGVGASNFCSGLRKALLVPVASVATISSAWSGGMDVNAIRYNFIFGSKSLCPKTLLSLTLALP